MRETKATYFCGKCYMRFELEEEPAYENLEHLQSVMGKGDFDPAVVMFCPYCGEENISLLAGKEG